MASESPEAIGVCGIFFAIVGPSGAGKDTLIDAARTHFDNHENVCFPRRIITRSEGVGEDHIPVDAHEFSRMKAGGEFFLHWSAHGLDYGLPAAIAGHLASGRVVISNVSRKVVGRAIALWPRTLVMHVTIAPNVLRQRLMARERENPEQIEARIIRATEVALPDHVRAIEIDNSANLADSAATLNRVIENTLSGT